MTEFRPLESSIENYFQKQCTLRGFWQRKFPAGGGVPDRIVIAPALTAFVELKRPGEKPRKLQLVIHRQMRNAGGAVFVASTKDEVDAVLDAIQEGRKTL